jgi:hypothetical protein
MAVAEAFIPTAPRRGMAGLGGSRRVLAKSSIVDLVGFGLRPLQPDRSVGTAVHTTVDRRAPHGHR